MFHGPGPRRGLHRGEATDLPWHRTRQPLRKVIFDEFHESRRHPPLAFRRAFRSYPVADPQPAR